MTAPLPPRPRASHLPGMLAIALALALTASPLCGQARMKITGEEQTHTSFIGIGSSYVSAQATAGPTKPVIMAGNFDLEVNFPGITFLTLIGSATSQSVFAGVLDNNGTDWWVDISPLRVDKLEPAAILANPNAETRDLAVVDRNEYYLAGIVDEATSFSNRDATVFPLLAAPLGPDERGFVATANDGTFTAARFVDANMQPVAAATDPAGSFLVFAGQERNPLAGDFEGVDAQIHRHSLPLPAGNAPLVATDLITDTSLQNLTIRDVVVTTNGDTWAGGSVPGATGLGGVSDLWIGKADFTTGNTLNEITAGSEGTDRLFKMERGPHGETFLAFTVSGRDVTFDALTYDLDTDPPVPVTTSTHAFLAMITRDGTPGWLTPLGFAQAAGGSLVPVDISIDTGGNAFVTMQGTGDFLIEGLLRNLAGTSQITVNGKGRVMDFTPTPGVADANCGAAPDIENRFVFGDDGTQSEFSTIESVAAPQASYFICSQSPGTTIDDLSAQVTGTGGQVHLELDYAANGTVAVSAWLTPDQFRILAGDNTLKVVADPLIIAPDSGTFASVPSPDWALARLFDPYLVDTNGPDADYYFPSGFVTPMSDEKVARVYVIDKGLAVNENFDFPDLGGGAVPIAFDGLGGLCVDALAHPVQNGFNEPDTTSNHPRQVVNLIAVDQLGSAQGTAIEFINVDMYTGASPEDDNCLTFASYVSYAILEALSDAAIRNLSNDLPTLIVIASSGMDPGDQVDIGNALDQALGQLVPVIISAGNGAGDVTDYVPAQHGDKEGVISVGATRLPGFVGNPSLSNLNPYDPQTNLNPPMEEIITLFAPGNALDTGFGSSSGTSFSGALVAGLAATYMSQNPNATPDQVEAALIEMSARDSVREINLARAICSFAAWLYRNGLGDLANCLDLGFGIDSDADGDNNFTEYLGGSDPLDPESRALIPINLSLSGTVATLTAGLPEPIVADDGSLHDGCWILPLEVQLSTDLENWNALDLQAGTLSAGLSSQGLRQLRFQVDLEPFHQEQCFLRFVFGPPVSP